MCCHWLMLQLCLNHLRPVKAEVRRDRVVSLMRRLPVVAASVARGACAEFSRRCTVLALSLCRRAPCQGLTASYAATLNLGSKEILHGTATLQYGPDAQHWRDDSLQQRSVPTDAGYRNRRSKTTANPQGGVA